MARIRSIHPGWFTDEAWVALSPFARLLGLGLLTQCDDQGAFEWKPITLKMRLFPVDNVDVSGLLLELLDADRVRKYEHDGKSYGIVRNFSRYQRPKKPNRTYHVPDKFLSYSGSDGSGSEPDEVESPSIPKKAELAPQREEGVGIGEEEGGGSAPARPPLVDLRTKIAGLFRELVPNRLVPDTNQAGVWLALGYDPELIVAVLRAGLARKPDVGSLNYFDKALREAHAGQQTSSAEPARPTSTERQIDFGGGFVWPESTVRRAVERWRADPQSWPPAIGPAPGKPGCRVPVDVFNPDQESEHV